MLAITPIITFFLIASSSSISTLVNALPALFAPTTTTSTTSVSEPVFIRPFDGHKGFQFHSGNETTSLPFTSSIAKGKRRMEKKDQTITKMMKPSSSSLGRRSESLVKREENQKEKRELERRVAEAEAEMNADHWKFMSVWMNTQTTSTTSTIDNANLLAVSLTSSLSSSPTASPSATDPDDSDDDNDDDDGDSDNDSKDDDDKTLSDLIITITSFTTITLPMPTMPTISYPDSFFSASDSDSDWWKTAMTSSASMSSSTSWESTESANPTPTSTKTKIVSTSISSINPGFFPTRTASTSRGSKTAIASSSSASPSPSSSSSLSGSSVSPTLGLIVTKSGSLSSSSTVTFTPTSTNNTFSSKSTTTSSSTRSPTSSALTTASPTGTVNGKLVFAHFMVGIVSTYNQTDWEMEMKTAKSKGIDGFALNVGTDDYTKKQLSLAYAAAEAIDFLVFISFDFNWFSTSDTSAVSSIISTYIPLPGQFRLPSGSAYVSSFAGDGFDWSTAASQSGQQVYVVPNNEPTSTNADAEGVSGLFSWYAWPKVDNKPVDSNMTTEYDQEYLKVTNGTDKIYMAPVSPWFFTHFGKEVSYSKNYLFKSETLWHTRWEQILEMQDQLEYIEMVTWNDYGESHHVGPLNDIHTDDGSTRWTDDLPHDALLDFAVPYIKAFKTGSKTPVFDDDMLIYWHRPTLKDVSCDGSDNCGSKPDGWDIITDTVFVTAFATTPGEVQVTSGSNSVFTQSIPAGVTMIEVPMAVGEQQFTFTTTGGTNLSGSSGLEVIDTCWNGTIYNYNIYTGKLM